jgi:hypothetical protein
MATFKPLESLASRTVDIELQDTKTNAKVTRGGITIAVPQADTLKVDDFVSRLPPVKRPTLPRVISQSPPAGTLVAPGTRIQITIVPPKDVQVGIFKGVHSDLANVFIAELLPIIDDPRVGKALAKSSTAAELSPEERAAVQEAATAVAQHANVNLQVDSSAQKNFDALYTTLQLVAAYT